MNGIVNIKTKEELVLSELSPVSALTSFCTTTERATFSFGGGIFSSFEYGFATWDIGLFAPDAMATSRRVNESGFAACETGLFAPDGMATARRVIESGFAACETGLFAPDAMATGRFVICAWRFVIFSGFDKISFICAICSRLVVA